MKTPPQDNPKNQDELDEIFIVHRIKSANGSRSYKIFLDKKAKQQIEALMTKRIGMLRQWLNEERIKDGSRFVTNEELEFWLGLRSKP